MHRFISFSMPVLTNGAAVLGILGYSLKGIECELSKGRLTSLQAELYLIRLRQAVHDLRTATQEEKEDIMEKWKAMHGHK